MPRVELEEVTSPASAQTVAKVVFPSGLVLSSNWAGFVAKAWQSNIKSHETEILQNNNATKRDEITL